MIARPVGTRTHIDVAMLRCIEHGIDCCSFGIAYNARRKSGITICVIRGTGFQHGAGYTLCLEIAGGEFHCGIGLQEHSPIKAVKIKTGNFGTFIPAVALLLHYRSKHTDLQRGKPQLSGLLPSGVIPKARIMLTDFRYQFFGCR